jgi:amino-acid N-acetyltransferase
LINQQSFVNWFRDSSPYIHAHRNRTFVISFGGEAVDDPQFANHIHDIALLNSLGIRLVLVHGIRPQIDARLQKLNVQSSFVKHLRITDDTALQCVKEAAGLVRVEIEALLSMGLANSPMAGAKIRVVSGNFVTAKPIGVIDGIDYCHTGEVRRIDSCAMQQQLEQNRVILISPVGYSPSGEVFNLCAEQVATDIAIALRAEKLVLLTEHSLHDPLTGQLIQQLTSREADAFLKQNHDLPCTVTRPIRAAIKSSQFGVDRTHLIKRTQDGALLLELFTRDGLGTLISSTPYEELRPATLNDIAGIIELITPLERQGKLIKRSREILEIEIADYVVIDRDGLIISCAALHTLADGKTGEIASFAVHQDYQKADRGDKLLKYIMNQARQKRCGKLFVLSTQTMHWFIERGFLSTGIESLPKSLHKKYNYQRNSKILYLDLQ